MKKKCFSGAISQKIINLKKSEPWEYAFLDTEQVKIAYISINIIYILNRKHLENAFSFYFNFYFSTFFFNLKKKFLVKKILEN